MILKIQSVNINWHIATVRLYRDQKPAVFFGSDRKKIKAKAVQYINNEASKVYQECRA